MRAPEEYMSDVYELEQLPNYSLDCKLESSDDANAVEVAAMFLKAMQVEGYAFKSILLAMYDVATYEAYQWDIKLEDEKEDTDE